MRTQTAVIILLSSLAFGPTQARAQTATTDSVVRAFTKEKGLARVGLAMRLLQQSSASYPRATLDAIGDSLVALVLTSNRPSEEQRLLQSSALEALAISGSSHAKVPYAGAGQRLYRLAMESEYHRGGAIYLITILADSTEALSVLRRIAVSENAIALFAVAELGESMRNKGGLQVLRELSRTGEAKDSTARKEITRLVRRFSAAKSP